MVLNFSKDGTLITDITKVVVPVNEKTVQAYNLIVEQIKTKEG